MEDLFARCELRVLNRRQTIELVGVSEKTWERLEAVGDIPIKTRLSQGRVGHRPDHSRVARCPARGLEADRRGRRGCGCEGAAMTALSDIATRTEIVTRLFDAFHEAASKPSISVLDVLLAAHLFLMSVEQSMSPDERVLFRQDMLSFQDMYAGAPEAFS